MNYFEIPLSPIPQVFAISLGGEDYRLTLQYRDGWILDVADDLGKPLVSGLPLVTGWTCWRSIAIWVLQAGCGSGRGIARRRAHLQRPGTRFPSLLGG